MVQYQICVCCQSLKTFQWTVNLEKLGTKYKFWNCLKKLESNFKWIKKKNLQKSDKCWRCVRGESREQLERLNKQQQSVIRPKCVNAEKVGVELRVQTVWQAERHFDPVIDPDVHLPGKAELLVDGLQIPGEGTARQYLAVGCVLCLVVCRHHRLGLLPHVAAALFLVSQCYPKPPTQVVVALYNGVTCCRSECKLNVDENGASVHQGWMTHKANIIDLKFFGAFLEIKSFKINLNFSHL